MAELSDAQKDAISHRGRAARALLAWLEPGGALGRERAPQSRLIAAATATASPRPA